MIRSSIAAFLLLTSLNVFAQENGQKILQRKLWLRFNFLGLADPVDQNLTVGVERYFRSGWSTGTDAGWIFSSNDMQGIKGASGFILRPFVRHYSNNKKSGFYEVELHYKYVAYKMEDWLGREPADNVPSYEEFTAFNLEKRAVGIHIKGGYQKSISRDDRFKLEFVMGFGLRYKWEKVDNGVYMRRGVFWLGNDPSKGFTSIAIPVNLRLLYALY